MLVVLSLVVVGVVVGCGVSERVVVRLCEEEELGLWVVIVEEIFRAVNELFLHIPVSEYGCGCPVPVPAVPVPHPVPVPDQPVGYDEGVDRASNDEVAEKSESTDSDSTEEEDISDEEMSEDGGAESWVVPSTRVYVVVRSFTMMVSLGSRVIVITVSVGLDGPHSSELSDDDRVKSEMVEDGNQLKALSIDRALESSGVGKEEKLTGDSVSGRKDQSDAEE